MQGLGRSWEPEQKPILEELARAGFVVSHIEQLYNKRMAYGSAVPILLKWLPKVSNSDLKEMIVRALTIPQAKGVAAPLLITEFKRTPASDWSLHWAIGNALEATATREHAPELRQLAGDKKYGKARQMVVLALGKLKDKVAISLLIDLLDDEDVQGHAIDSLGKLRATEALSRLRPFLDHKNSWLRREARNAVARIEQAEAKP